MSGFPPRGWDGPGPGEVPSGVGANPVHPIACIVMSGSRLVAAVATAVLAIPVTGAHAAWAGPVTGPLRPAAAGPGALGAAGPGAPIAAGPGPTQPAFVPCPVT